MPHHHTPPPPAPESVELVSQFGHDFNNLLGIILGGLSLLQEDLPASAMDDELREILADTLSATQEASVLVERLTAAVGRQIAHAGLVDLNEVLQTAAEPLQSALAPGVELAFAPAAEPAMAWTDAARVQECLVELVGNAARTMGGTGRITVRCAGGPAAELRVEDDGPGMSPQELEHCTRPYVTHWREQGHRGLGLGMVNGFMQLSAGELQLRSEPGVGTTVVLRFPSMKRARRHGLTAAPAAAAGRAR
jgi:signal transduction histidine kinase